MATFYLESVPLEPIFRLFEVATTFLSLSNVRKTQNKHCGGLLPGPGSANLAVNSGQKFLLASSSEDLLLAPNGLFTPVEIEEWLFSYSRAFCLFSYFINLSFFTFLRKNLALTMHISPEDFGEIMDIDAEERRVSVGCELPFFEKMWKNEWSMK